MRDARPVLLVTGLGRCGMTATMNALHAGGVPCAGPPPAFEPPEAMLPMSAAWLGMQAGRAVKTLMPQESPAIREVEHVAIVLRRDPAEQAGSQCKLLEQLMGIRLTRRDRQAMSASIPADQRAAERSLRRIVLVLTFEGLLRDPGAAMARIAASIRPWWSLDVPAAARIIRQRSPRCAPDMQMEISMVETTNA